MARALGMAGSVVAAGYVPERLLDDYLEACDVCVCLRWPSAGETSASWLRCLAAGKPTVITELAQHAALPRLDPRGWVLVGGIDGGSASSAVSVAVDPADEERLLSSSLARLARDGALREQLGANARAYWRAAHTLEQMAEDYVEAIGRALETRPPTRAGLPAHFKTDGAELARRLARDVGAAVDFLAGEADQAVARDAPRAAS
jgi:hypothetical protein